MLNDRKDFINTMNKLKDFKLHEEDYELLNALIYDKIDALIEQYETCSNEDDKNDIKDTYNDYIKLWVKVSNLKKR